MKLIIAIIFLWGFNVSAFALNLPERIDISYSVKTGMGHGELYESVEIIQNEEAHTYSIYSAAQASGIMRIIKPGSIVRTSRGVITKEGLRPNYFADQRANKKPSIALFDWKNKQLTMDHKDEETQLELPDDTMDRLSMSYRFMFTPLDRDNVDVHITDGRSLELTRYSVTRETIKTPIGKLQTLLLTRQPEKDKVKRKIWLAIDHYLLPVRIVSTEKDGLQIEKMIKELHIHHTSSPADHAAD